MPRAGKFIENSEEAYTQLKVITDAAQSGELKPWGPKVIELLNAYGVTVERRRGIQAEITLSFPTSTKGASMAIGVRHLKPDNSWAEDMFLFEESIGLTKFYKGVQEDALPEYDDTHHGAPSIQLQESIPSIQQDIAQLKVQLAARDIFSSVDLNIVTTPNEHKQQLDFISQDFQNTSRSIASRASGTPIAHISMKIKPEFDKRRAAQMNKWAKSEALYNLKVDQIGEVFAPDSEEYQVSIARLDKLFGKTAS